MAGIDPFNFDDCSGQWNGIMVNHVHCQHDKGICLIPVQNTVVAEAIMNLRKLYGHAKKRLFDEYAIDLTQEWEQRVIGGEHDVPFPRT